MEHYIFNTAGHPIGDVDDYIFAEIEYHISER